MCLTTLTIAFATSAQNVGINSTGATPSSDAMLDISSTNKGLLIPRVALTGTGSATPITSPTTSLLVYNTATVSDVVPGYYYWNGTSWQAFLISESDDWTTSGNAGTTAGTNFIGTTDATDFVIKTNNSEVARATSGGRIGVGTTNPSQQMVSIDASTFTLAGNATGVDNLYLEDHSEGSGQNNIGGSISFSGPYNGGGGAQRRHAAIAGVQTGSTENDYVGLSFYTHNSSVSTGNMQESMRLTHDGVLSVGTNSPGTGALLDINSTNKGVLFPRVALSSTGSASPVTSPTTSLLVYNTATVADVTPGFYYWNGSAWTALAGGGGGSGWELTGNSGTTAGTNFVGTTDATDLVFKTNSSESMRIANGGNVGIGTTTPDTELEVIGEYSQSAFSTSSGLTQTIINGSWSGGTGSGASGVIGTMGSHRSWHYDVIVTAHDVNSCTNRRNVHREFIVYRQWTNTPVLQNLVTHYDQTTGAAITVNFATNASNEITYTLTQTSGGSTNINYRILVRLIEAR